MGRSVEGRREECRGETDGEECRGEMDGEECRGVCGGKGYRVVWRCEHVWRERRREWSGVGRVWGMC